MLHRRLNYALYCKIQNWLIAIATITLTTGTSLPAIAQLKPDASLGEESSVVTPDVEVKGENADRIDGGAIRDRNLFHSFQDFNVEDSQRVYFANPDNIEQIFTRVTGSNSSNINGTLGVDGAADLLLLNPNGILFGENSSLDVEGSFFGTTADSVLFEDGEEFSAVNPDSSLLTVSVPLGLQVGDNPGNIEVRSPLEVPNGQNFSLVGGEINLTGSNITTDKNGINSAADGITAPGGRVELGSLLNKGIVNIADSSNSVFPEDSSRDNINFDNYFINTSAGGGGSITLQSQNLKLINSILVTGINSSVESTQAQAGDIIIDTTQATIIEATGNNQSAILNTTGENTTGDLSELSLSDNNVEVVNSTGNAGNILINTNSLSVTGFSPIYSFTNGEGNAGSIRVNADSFILLDSSGLRNAATGIGSFVDSLATGEGADIRINAKSLSSKNSGVASSTLGSGNAGDIQLNISESIALTDNSVFSTGSSSAGNAGNLMVNVSETLNLSGTLTLDDETNFPTGLFTLSVNANATAGDIEISTGKVNITKGAQIQASTISNGDGGNITIKANEIQLAGNSAIDFPTGIASGTSGSGSSGSVKVITNDLVIQDNAGISVNSLADGNAGEIVAKVNSYLTLDDGRISSRSDRSSGGEISIDAGSIQLKGDSDILTNVANGAGGGGNITLSADLIVAFEDSDILANSADGRGGNITLDTDAFFAAPFNRALVNSNSGLLNGNSRVDINATGSVDGIIEIPEINFLPNNLVQLTEETVDAEDTIANSCVVRQGESGGTLLVTGSGSLSASPGDASISNYATGSVRSIPDEQAINSAKSNWQPGDPVVEPERAYRLSNGKLVLSRECG